MWGEDGTHDGVHGGVPGPTAGQPRGGGAQDRGAGGDSGDGARWAGLGGVRAGADADGAGGVGGGGTRGGVADHVGDPGAAGGAVPVVLANDPGVSGQRRKLNGGAGEPGGPGRAAGGGGADAGLHAERGGGDLGRGGGADVRGAGAARACAAALPRDPCGHHGGEPSGDEGVGACHGGADLPVHRAAGVGARDGTLAGLGRGCDAYHRAACRGAGCGGCDGVARAAGVRGGVYGDDRGGGGQQRGWRVSRAPGEACAPNADGDRARAGGVAAGGRLPFAGVRRDCDGRDSAGVSKRAVAAGGGGAGAGLAVLRDDRERDRCAEPVREHELRGVPAAVPAGGGRRVPVAGVRDPGAAAGVRRGHAVLGGGGGGVADGVRGHHGPADPAVRGGGIPVVHVEPGGDGAALAECPRGGAWTGRGWR